MERFRDGFALVDIASGRQNIKKSYLTTIISFQKIKDSRYTCIHSNFSKRPYLFGNPHHHFRSARNSVLAPILRSTRLMPSQPPIPTPSALQLPWGYRDVVTPIRYVSLPEGATGAANRHFLGLHGSSHGSSHGSFCVRRDGCQANPRYQPQALYSSLGAIET